MLCYGDMQASGFAPSPSNAKRLIGPHSGAARLVEEGAERLENDWMKFDEENDGIQTK